MLVARFRRVLGLLVCDTQSAFTGGRCMYDDWVVALEVVDEMSKEKERLIFNLMLFNLVVEALLTLINQFEEISGLCGFQIRGFSKRLLFCNMLMIQS